MYAMASYVLYCNSCLIYINENFPKLKLIMNYFYTFYLSQLKVKINSGNSGDT